MGISKIQTVTMGNASPNNSEIERPKQKLKEKNGTLVLEGEVLHNRCVFYITNLIIGDCLKELSPSIASIWNAVRYVRSSFARLKRFMEVVEEEQIESNALLCMDVQTRWNSTFFMLE